GDDAVGIDRKRVILEHDAVRLDRNDPARFDEEVDRNHARGRWSGGSPGVRPHFTRETYSPERVSTLIFSPFSMNSGTRTVAPVSSLAGLPPPEAVSPRMPGSVSTMSSSTKFGGVTCKGVPFHSVTTHISLPLSHCAASAIAVSSAPICSCVSGCMKCQNSPSE